MKHTPGPWKVEIRATHGVFGHTTHVVSMDKSHIAEVSPCAIEANAKLIAAAPDMLKVLQGVIHHNDGLKKQYKTSPSLIDQIEQVIKKAIE